MDPMASPLGCGLVRRRIRLLARNNSTVCCFGVNSMKQTSLSGEATLVNERETGYARIFLMPRTKSAAKSLRTALRRAAENTAFKKRLYLALKKPAKSNLAHVISLIDKAAARHILHKNKAARLKSRLYKKFGNPTPAKKLKPALKKQTKRPKH